MQYISIGMRDINTVLSLAKLTLEVLSGYQPSYTVENGLPRIESKIFLSEWHQVREFDTKQKHQCLLSLKFNLNYDF